MELLEGADAHRHLPELAYLTGLGFRPGPGGRDLGRLGGVLAAQLGRPGAALRLARLGGAAVVAGLGDEHWRPAEMCLKVATRHEVGGAGDGAVALSAPTSCRGCARRRCGRSRSPATPSTSTRSAAGLDDEQEDVRRQAARALEQMSRRLDLVGPTAMSPAYSFRGTWAVPAPVPRVQEVLLDLERYPEWWPQVRAVAKLGDDDARVLCRSALPYTLDLLLHAERREPTLLETSLAGDLDGVVRWRLADDADGTRMDFEQDVHVTGRLLARRVVRRPPAAALEP